MKKGEKMVVKSLILEGVYPNIPFGDTGDKRHFLNTLLRLKKNSGAGVLAYSVNKDSVNLLLCAGSEKFIDDYVWAVAGEYSEFYSKKYSFNGMVFRAPARSELVKRDAVGATIGYIHMTPARLGLTDNFKKYRFSSCRSYVKGYNELLDKELTAAAAGLESFDTETFYSWHNAPNGKKVPGSRGGLEKFDEVMTDLRLKYETGIHTGEDVLKWYIYELNKRCAMPYHKIVRRLGVPLKKRRDLLAEVLFIMCKNDGCEFLQAVANLKLKMKNMTTFGLLAETAVSALNRYGFSYDYLINILKVEDYNFQILTNIIKLINRDYGYGFVQIATNLHLQVDRQEVLYSTLQSMCFDDGMSLAGAVEKLQMDFTSDLLMKVLISANLKYGMYYEDMLRLLKIEQVSDYILISIVRELIAGQQMTFETAVSRLGLRPPYDAIRALV